MFLLVLAPAFEVVRRAYASPEEAQVGSTQDPGQAAAPIPPPADCAAALPVTKAADAVTKLRGLLGR